MRRVKSIGYSRVLRCLVLSLTLVWGNRALAVSPSLSAVRVPVAAPYGATITWDTDIPASSQVQFGTSMALGSSTVNDATSVRHHTVYLSGLSAQTTYYYRVVSSGAQSSIQSFVTGVEQNGSGNTFFVSPQGLPTNDGRSVATAWDLQTALCGGRNVAVCTAGGGVAEVTAGDTVVIKGGTYVGNFRSYLSGQSTKPIVVRAADGERVTLDSFFVPKLGENITATATTISFVDARTLKTNDLITIDGEGVLLGARQGNTFTGCQRGADKDPTGTTLISPPAVHTAASAAVRLWGNGLTVNGAHTWFQGLEILSSYNDTQYQRVYPGDWFDAKVQYQVIRDSGVTLNGVGSKLINCLIHDNLDGVDVSGAAWGAEVNGCILSNNGYEALGNSDPGQGHGMYIHNSDPTQIQLYKDIISLNHYGVGMKAYTSGGDYSRHLRFNGITSFNNGSVLSSVGANYRRVNLEMAAAGGTLARSMEDLEASDCVLYHPLTVSGAVGNAMLGYSEPTQDDLRLLRSFVYGGSPLSIAAVQSATVSGNEFGSSNVVNGLVTLRLLGAGVLANSALLSIDNNRYLHPAQDASALSFAYCGSANNCNLTHTWATWQSAFGWDTHGFFGTADRLNQAWIPSGTRVIVRPNDYVRGRANITILNWAHAPTVTVSSQDLQRAGISAGEHYDLHNAEDYYGDVALNGTVSTSGEISIPMSAAAHHVARPIGGKKLPATTLPEFGAFVIVKRSSATTGDTLKPAAPSNLKISG